MSGRQVALAREPLRVEALRKAIQEALVTA
jgi:hypothetical protein